MPKPDFVSKLRPKWSSSTRISDSITIRSRTSLAEFNLGRRPTTSRFTLAGVFAQSLTDDRGNALKIEVFTVTDPANDNAPVTTYTDQTKAEANEGSLFTNADGNAIVFADPGYYLGTVPRTGKTFPIVIDPLVADINNTVDPTVMRLPGTETVTGDKNSTGALTHTGHAVVDTTDSRLTDPRTPIDGSVTLAKLNSALLPGGKLDPNLLPAMVSGAIYPVSSQAAMLALTVNPGDIAKRTDIDGGAPFMYAGGGASTLANWTRLTADYALSTDLTTEVSRAEAAEVIKQARFIDQLAAQTGPYSAIAAGLAIHYNVTSASVVQPLPTTGLVGDEIELYLDASDGTNTLSATFGPLSHR